VTYAIQERASGSHKLVDDLKQGRKDVELLMSRMKELRCDSVIADLNKSIGSIDKQLETIGKEEKKSIESRDKMCEEILAKVKAMHANII
jgi:hypothetical protein